MRALKLLAFLVCFVAQVAFAAPAFIQSATQSNGAGNTSIALNSTTTTGNLIVVAIMIESTTATVSTVTDNSGSTYQAATSISAIYNSGYRLQIYYAYNITGRATHTVTVTASAAVRTNIQVVEYSGVESGSNPLDVVSSGTEADDPSSGSATSTTNGSLIFSTATSGGTLTAGAGFTRRSNDAWNIWFATEDQNQTTAGSIAATWVTSGTNTGLAQMAVFKATGAGGATPTPTITPTPTVTPTYAVPTAVPCKQDWKDQWEEWSAYQFTYMDSQNSWTTWDPADNTPSTNQNAAYYYDAFNHNLIMPALVGNLSTIAARQSVMRRSYRDGYVDYYNGGANGFTVFTASLRKDFETTGDLASKQAVYDLSRNAAFADGLVANTADPNALTTDGGARENAYRIMAELDARALGYTPRANLDDYLDQAITHLGLMTNPQTTSFTKVFFVAIVSKALIQAYEEYPAYPNRANIQPAIVAAADWVWANAWVPYSAGDIKSQAFLYAYPDGTEGETGGQPDLNGLIVPVYGWLYKQTTTPKWRERGDTIFCNLITVVDGGGFYSRGPSFGNTSTAATSLAGKKAFNQTYQWSAYYVSTAEQPFATPTPTPAPGRSSTLLMGVGR